MLTRRTRPLSPSEKKLVSRNIGLVGHVIEKEFRSYLVKRAKVRGEDRITYHDLHGAGVVGLIDAIEKWRPKDGKFTTCAYYWIKNKIHLWLSETKETIRVTRHGRAADNNTGHKAKQAKNIASIDNGHEYQAPNRRDLKELRRFILKLLYSVKATSPLERLGRVIVIRVAGLNGGTGIVSKPLEVVDASAKSLGIEKSQARKAWRAILKLLRSRWPNMAATLWPRKGESPRLDF